MLALALPLPILVGEVCGPLPLPYLILELVGGQVTGRRGDWAEDADAHPVGLIASPSYRQIPKHFLWQWAGGGTAIGDWAEDGMPNPCRQLCHSGHRGISLCHRESASAGTELSCWRNLRIYLKPISDSVLWSVSTRKLCPNRKTKGKS